MPRVLGIDPGSRISPLGSEDSDVLLQLLEAVSVTFDVLAVVEVLADDHVNPGE